MKQTIEIEVPDGKRAVWKDNKIVFEDIKPRLPKTWDEFCEQNLIKRGEYFLNSFSTSEQGTCETIRHKDSDRNILPNKQATEQHLALMQLHQLRDCYRQGWTPDWNNSIQNKYVIYNLEGKFTISPYYCHSHFLAFQNEKRAEEFLTNFRDLIKQAGDLI